MTSSAPVPARPGAPAALPTVDRDDAAPPTSVTGAAATTPELGGPKGPEPTRYGDWERNGRCVDF